jgi:sugar lactone lactonase YvrE/enterochelin esterase-like enzyme
MKKILTIILITQGLLFYTGAFAQAPAENYPVDSASVEHAGVPKGELIHCTFNNSAIFPGTRREYWIYIPAQYHADHPACLYVNQDGIQWKAPTVFDNLIQARAMPVTIGVFIQPGRVTAADSNTALDRYNRSFEYDGLGDAYVRFLVEELLPDVEKHQASDGRAINLSKNGNDRAIGGSSSGAIAAFTAAWERPDVFSRVFSAIGTYVGLRGGDRYPSLIRKYEPRRLRVFLQDGSNDQNIYGGDWWMANQTMERALTFAGYEVRHAWGEGSHNGAQGTSIFPEAMRWLWKSWPQPVAKGNTGNQTLHDLLIPGQDWELVGQGYGFTEGTAADAAGNVFYQDIPASKTYRVGADGKPRLISSTAQRASGTSFGSDGSRYEVAGATRQVLRYSAAETGRSGTAAMEGFSVVAEGLAGNDLAVARNGNVYVTVPDGDKPAGKIYLIKATGQKLLVDSGLRFVNGLTFTPDQTQLYVAESASHWIWVYSIRPDGTLYNKQHYGWLEVPDNQENAWPDGVKCDREGRVFVTTRMGIQILDQLGRVNAILPVPSGQPSNCAFGGPNFDVLYVSCGDKVYRRKLKVRGANSFETPARPPAPRL